MLSYYPSGSPLASGTSALLWLPGRNDAFFHPHVASRLASHGIDLYVLSYKRVGVCRRLRLFDNPMHNSHTASGSFKEYHEDIDEALAFLRARGRRRGGGDGDGNDTTYKRVLGYGHSTGCPALLDYVMARGDAAFDGFIFNSPFLDWGLPGKPLTKLFLTYAPAMLVRLGVWRDDTELLGGGGENAWAYQLYSQFPFNPADRPLYTVPVTIGFVRGINAAHAELRRRSRAGTAITRKPFLVLTSMHDDVLEGDEMAVAAHAIGPNRTLVQLCHARHDVFMSSEAAVIGLALDNLRAWLLAHGYPERDEETRAAARRYVKQDLAMQTPHN